MCIAYIYYTATSCPALPAAGTDTHLTSGRGEPPSSKPR